MVVALKEVKIRGEIRTIVDYAMEMIQSPDFVGNNIHTGWLDSRIASQVGHRQSRIVGGGLLAIDNCAFAESSESQYSCRMCIKTRRGFRPR